MTLRDALHKVEESGMVDFDLGAHVCQRPSSVVQGQDDDDRSVSQLSPAYNKALTVKRGVWQVLVR